MTKRFLHFENIDMKKPDIHALCSECGQEFIAIPQSGEPVDDLLLRMRAEFNAHVCKTGIPAQ